MAHYFFEHASQAVSRESEAALIPFEKHAILTQPLGKNTPKPAQKSTGTDTRGAGEQKQQGSEKPIGSIVLVSSVERVVAVPARALPLS